MNKNSSVYSFLLEYLFAVMFFVLCTFVTMKIHVASSLVIDLSLQKREALEYVTNYIENGDYDTGEYHLDERFNQTDNGYYDVTVSLIDKKTGQMEISVIHGDETLITMPFYGGCNE